MHLRSIIIGIATCFAVALPAKAQFLKKYFTNVELIGGVGTTSYFGDVGGKDDRITGIVSLFDNLDVDLWQVRTMFTVGARIKPYEKVGVNLQISPVFLSGNDLHSNYAFRGYSFKTSIIEASLMGEYYIVDQANLYSPYGTLGFSGLLYSYKNSTTELRSKWYGGNAFIFGGGVRFPTQTNLTQSLDFSFHFTATDNLDGMKTARNSKDLFFILSYKVNFQVRILWY
ncbi:MAG: hypothetical protein WCW62_15685 [Bacteroidales bacterium]